MRRLKFVLLALVSLTMTYAHAEVWRCKEGERVVFSDTPCPKTGRQLDDRVLNANVLPTERPMPSRPRAPDDTTAYGTGGQQVFGPRAGPAAPTPRQNTCPDDLEIRNMQVKSSSITLGRREKDFLEDEIRRARQCRKGQGNYSAEDWQASREAQNAQSDNTNRETARRRAEGVHSAADPIEGDRIAATRTQEAAAQAFAVDERRRQDAARAKLLVDSQIGHCTSAGCYTADGKYYRRSGGGQFYGPTGLCRVEAGGMRCP